MSVKETVKFESQRDLAFAQWIKTVTGGERILQCIQCGLCSATCPVSFYMDYTPRRLIHLAKEGFKQEVLGSSTIWLCCSCYACTTECSKKIKVTDIMYILKRRAIEEGIYPKGLAIPVLAREFYKMVRSRGRLSESWLIFRLFLKTGIFKMLQMQSLGLKLMLRGRLSLKMHSIKNRKNLKTVLDFQETKK